MPVSEAGRKRQLEFWDLIRAGKTATGACEAMGVNRRQGYRWIKAAGGRVPTVKTVTSGRYLGQDDRLTIADLRLAGAGVRQIARELGRAPSTISRELRHNAGKRAGTYRPHTAQKQAGLRACRPKDGKLEDPRLIAAVEARPVKNWSPQQISDDLKQTFADREEMQVSHETIYQSLFVQGRGHLKADLHKHLRTGRVARKSRGHHLTANPPAGVTRTRPERTHPTRPGFQQAHPLSCQKINRNERRLTADTPT